MRNPSTLPTSSGMPAINVRPTAVAGSVAAALLLCANAQAASPSFTDITDSAGLTFKFRLAPDAPVGRMHGGGTVADFNGDGYPDLFVVGGGGDGTSLDALFINQQDGTFVNEASAWGLDGVYRGNGAVAGDYNNDGHIDLYVTSMGDLDGPPRNGQHRLYRNNGDGTFTDVASSAGVRSTADWPDGYGPVFGDYDLDGDLDLWVPGWHFGFLPEVPRSRLFANNGDGTFSDVTASAGVELTNLIPIGAFCGAFADMNGDRYPELLIVGDAGTSLYYINNGDGSFTPQEIFIPDRPVNAMGTAIADFDRNGHPDWYISAAYPAFRDSGPPGNRLYMNAGNHTFTALPETAGINDTGWSWGAAARDFDHDGFIDLLITNGWLTDDPVTGEVWTNEPTYLMRNNGDSTFTDVAASYGLAHVGQGRGLTEMDYDRDGDMDAVIYSFNEPLVLMRNDLQGPDANWLTVTLDTRARPDLAPAGQGSWLHLSSNGQTDSQQIVGANSFLGRGELIAHFGLGSAASVDQLAIHWNDGSRTLLRHLAVNQRLTVAAPAQGQGRVLLPPPVGGVFSPAPGARSH